jgi:hypothetical protein
MYLDRYLSHRDNQKGQLTERYFPLANPTDKTFNPTFYCRPGERESESFCDRYSYKAQ